MANPVERPCSECGAPVKTQRMTSTPTCSTKCYQRLRQRNLKDVSKLEIKLGNVTLRFEGLPDRIDKIKFEAKLLALLATDGLLETISNHNANHPLPDIHISR